VVVMDVRRAIELLLSSLGAERKEDIAFFMALMIPYGVSGMVRELEWDFQAGVLGGESMLKKKLVKIWQ
jgi:hypothetical protein